MPVTDEANLAIFCDFENIAIGVREAKFDDFDIQLTLERLLDKGRIIYKRAYCDWERYKTYRRAMHEAAFELVEVPHISYSGKNSADIYMVVDALDVCYTREHIDTFVILSGDSDFSPLVRKLRENNKRVLGLGVKNSSSDLLVESCDEFIFYDDLVRRQQGAKRKQAGRRKASSTKAKAAPKAKSGGNGKTGGTASEAPGSAEEAIDLVMDTAEVLLQERDGNLWGSIVKQTIKRKRPHFDESYYGYRTFSDLLEDLQGRQLLDLKMDDKSGSYIITSLGPDA